MASSLVQRPLASQSAISTPKNTPNRSTPLLPNDPSGISTPSPGTWRHPRFDEITRRQKANEFDETNIRIICWNAGAVIILWSIGNFFQSYPDFYRLLIPAIVRLLVQDYSKSTFFLAYSLPLYNIAMAVLPLIKTRDELTDIPLTPSQRALMGLDPNAKSSTSDTQYITPPRYARSVTPRSSSGGWPSNDSNSPFSRRESPLYGRDRSDSPFSPSGSPLWQKAISKDRDAARRSSLGSPSPLGPGFNPKESILGVPSTPSPTAGKNTSVSLNSRWLYNRGRTSLARN